MATNYEEWLHAPNFGVTNPMFPSPGTPGTIASIRGGEEPFPSSMITTIKENDDGSGSSKRVENLVDGSSVTTELKIPKRDGKGFGGDYSLSTGGWTAILEDWEAKRLANQKEKELNRMAEAVPNLEEEKTDVFRDNDNYTDWFSNFLRGERRPPRQYLQGQTIEERNQAIQAGVDARYALTMEPNMASRHPEIFDLDGFDRFGIKDTATTKTGQEFPPGYPEEKGRPPVLGDPAVGSGVPALRGEELEESIFDQEAEGMQYAYAGPGTSKGEGKALRGRELAESLSPVTQEIIETAAQEIDAAGDDEVEKERIFESVKEGLFDFANMNPQLAKSILSTIAALMMGSSFGDAIATGFGVHEEAAMEEEAADKAASQEVIGMLIDNAEWINDENFWKTLEAYGITPDSEAGQIIADKWSIAKHAANSKKVQTTLAAELAKIDELYDEVTDVHVNDKNRAYVYDAITRFIPYAKEQLRNSKTPSFITDERTKSGIVAAIAEYTRQVDEALEDGYTDKAARLRQQGIEAIWEGMQGSFQFIDGKLESSVIIPADDASLLHAQRVMMGTMWKDTKKSQEFEATVHAEWIKDYFGKKGKFNKEDDFVEFLAFRVMERMQEENE